MSNLLILQPTDFILVSSSDANVDFSAHYADRSFDGHLFPDSIFLTTDSESSVGFLMPPKAGFTRLVKNITMFNRGESSTTVNISIQRSSLYYGISSTVLPGGTGENEYITLNTGGHILLNDGGALLHIPMGSPPSNSTIHNLPLATPPLTGAEELPANFSGVDEKVTVQQIANFIISIQNDYCAVLCPDGQTRYWTLQNNQPS